MNSRHYAAPQPAKRYSPDGQTWIDVPDGINVLGSRYALVLKSLEEHEEPLNLAATRVATGPNAGRVGSRYVRGQADKACLEVVESERINEEKKVVQINLVAELIEPYAVFLSET